MPEEGINPVQFPEILKDVWEWFVGLSGRRKKSGFGPELIEWSAMESYFRLMKTEPEPWQVRAIDRLDQIWFAAQQEEQ